MTTRRAEVSGGFLLRYCVYSAGVLLLVTAALYGSGTGGSLTVGVCAYGLIVLTLHALDSRGCHRPEPHHVVLGAFEFYFMAGMIMFIVRERYWYNYYAEMPTVFWSGVYMTFAMWAGVWLHRRIRSRRGARRGAKIALSAQRLEAVAVAFAVVGWLGAAGIVVQTRIVPVLSAGVDSARVQVSQQASGFLLPMIMLGIIAIIFRIASEAVRRESGLLLSTGKAIAFGFAASPPLLLYGGRFFIILPLALVALWWTWRSKRASAQFVLPAAAIGGFALSMALVVLRIFGSAATRAQATRAVMNDLFPEMRVFGMALYQVPRSDLWQNIIGTVTTGLMPGALAGFLGIDKTALYRPMGRTILASLYQFRENDILGIRISILGEVHLAFGLMGVVTMALLIGFAASSLTSRLRRGGIDDTLIATVFTALLVALMPYGSVFLITVLTIGVPTLIGVRLAHAPGAERSQGGRD